MFGELEQLRLGDHIALFYRSKAEQFACAIPYMRIGLGRNERCIYIAEENSVAEIRRCFHEAGVNVPNEEARGALSIVTKDDTYLRHSVFEADKMVEDFHSEAEMSLEKGFSGFRAAGEMSWALDLPSTLPRLIDYEEQLHLRWPAKLTGLCQYNESLFPPHVIESLIQRHKIIIRNGRIIRRVVTVPFSPLLPGPELACA